jgi:hypothetical protein
VLGRVASAGTDAVRPFVRFTLRHWVRHDEFVRLRQQVRYLGYSTLLARQPTPPRDLTLYEFSIFSQNGEDGVLQEIFHRIGTTNQFFVEVGASVNESNTVFLADILGWRGILFDASQSEADSLALKYSSSDRVIVKRAFVDAENVNELLSSNNIPKHPDLMSLDIDGNDFWVWAALEVIRPRVLIVEYNAHVSPATMAVQPYAPDIPWDGSSFFGASLASFRTLGQTKGYRLVHIDSTGINLIFVDEGSLEPDTPFLAEDEVTTRVPNYYLYGLRHPSPGEGSEGHCVDFLPETRDS